MGDYRKLIVWQRSHTLSVAIYRLLQAHRAPWPGKLSDQLAAATHSIGVNIAEGSNQSPAQFARYLSISLGSADEAWAHVHLARELDLLDESANGMLDELREIRAMLFALRAKVRKDKGGV